MTVAALFVETDGPYFGIPGIEPWDKAKDARKYAGPWPVVAHPPCQLWGPFAAINYIRWGGDHNKPGNDGGCFEAALRSVRSFGGVLEHPAATRAWPAYDLPRPLSRGWIRTPCGGWVCEVWQSAYGHKANKATWLYAHGFMPPELDWRRISGTHQIGQHDQRGKGRNKPTLSGRAASATPPAFRDLLVSMARSAGARAAA